MKVQVENTGACRKVLHVEVPEDVVADEYKKVTSYFASAVRVAGFRKGKAPVALVEKQHKEGIIEETKDRLLPKYYHEALKSESIEPLTIVGVSEVTIDPSQPMVFDVTIDVKPEFSLPDYTGLKLKGESVDVLDKDIDNAITDIRERGARFEDI
jgi:trigger factor